MRKLLITAFLAVFLSPLAAQAGNVGITKDIMSITVQTKNGPVKIIRNQDNSAVIAPDLPRHRVSVPRSVFNRKKLRQALKLWVN